MKWKRSWVRRAEVLPIALAVALALLASGASAYTVDQRNDSAATGGYHSIPNYTPIGQEFRPDLDHVDVAELYVKAMGFVSDPTEFLVEVHALDASGEEAAECTMVMHCNYDGTNAPVKIDTASAIT